MFIHGMCDYGRPLDDCRDLVASVQPQEAASTARVSVHSKRVESDNVPISIFPEGVLLNGIGENTARER